MEYTIEIHKKNLKKILKTDNPCGHCPSTFDQYAFEETGNQKFTNEDDICEICRSFVGLNSDISYDHVFCPCVVLGNEEALKRTYEALDM